MKTPKVLKSKNVTVCLFVSSLSLLFSLFAIAVSFYCNVNATKVTWDLIGILASILSTLVAIIVFMLGYNYITYERRMSESMNAKIEEVAKSVDAVHLFFTNKNNIVTSHNGSIYGALEGIVCEMDNENKYMSGRLLLELTHYVKDAVPEDISLERSFKYRCIEALTRLESDDVDKCIDFIEKCTIKGGDKIKD